MKRRNTDGTMRKKKESKIYKDKRRDTIVGTKKKSVISTSAKCPQKKNRNH